MIKESITVLIYLFYKALDLINLTTYKAAQYFYKRYNHGLWQQEGEGKLGFYTPPWIFKDSKL
jgi:hypothetical protein